MLDIEKINSAVNENNELIASVIYFDKINSTNLYAKTIDEDGVLILTDNQSQGVGRMKRKWDSSAGKNLTFTIKKTFEIDTRHIQAVNFFFSYFILAWMKDFIAKKLNGSGGFPEIRIKWPNDILLDSKKVCGFLIENTFNKNQFIIGIGLNINQESFPDEFNEKASSAKR
jgi:BirA family biotin operon repressor/biotin-[acetyl-CoA-carboxylase] ligase